MDNKNFYHKYCDDCHGENACDYRIGEPIRRLDIPSQSPYWTGSGTAGAFMWRALTSVYVPEVHTINSIKQSYNDYHDWCRMKGGVGMMDLIIQSIDDDPFLSEVLNDVHIVNFNDAYAGKREKIVMDGIVNYLSYVFSDNDNTPIFEFNSNRVNINPSVVSGKDLLFPDLFVTSNTLKRFSYLASGLCKAGANTCVGIFITRMIPNERGQYPSGLPKEMGLPVVKGLTLDDLVNLL